MPEIGGVVQEYDYEKGTGKLFDPDVSIGALLAKQTNESTRQSLADLERTHKSMGALVEFYDPELEALFSLTS